MVNAHTAFRDDILPFGGLRHSGPGVGGIPYTIDDMQIDKMMVTEPPETASIMKQAVKRSR